MRLAHFKALEPVCPLCRISRDQDNPLRLATVVVRDGDTIVEGVLHCANSECMLEYPIIDRIPVLIPDIRAYISENVFHIVARDDLSETIESMLGDSIGPGTGYDSTRQHLSAYAWDHYADLDPAEPSQRFSTEAAAPGSISRCIQQGLDLINRDFASPVIDLGCAAGRTAFEMAVRGARLVLGVDLNFSLLRIAQRVLTSGLVRYPRRRVGIVYDRREFPVQFANSANVDFWACDVLALPFPSDTFGLAVGLNVLDSVSSPRDFLASVGRVLGPEGSAILATPYDWSPAATPMETWIGGHSQRGPLRGASEPILKSLLTPAAHPQSIDSMKITGEITDLPWYSRLHDRSTVAYSVHVIAAKATGESALDEER